MVEDLEEIDIKTLLNVIAQQQMTIQQYERKNSDISFCNAYENWLDEHTQNVARITGTEYRRIFKTKLEPFFEGYKLSDVTSENIECFYLSRKREGVKENTILRAHSNLFTFFKWSIKKELIFINPFDKVTRPKIKDKFMPNYYDVEEIKELLKAAACSKLYTPILISSILGLRRSEIAGLKWDAIDFKHRTIKIKRKISYDRLTNNYEVLAQLKNSSSYRVLPLPDFVLNHLEQLKKTNEVKFKKSPDKDFICLDENGKILLLQYITAHFLKLLKSHGLPRIRFHDLRHSCATMLLNLGYSMKEIQEWLGHSTFETTAKYYTHVNMKNKFVLSENLNTIFTTEE